MKRSDILAGLFAGLITGVFLIPTVKNINLFQKIPSPYLLMLVGLPIAAAIGVWVLAMVGRAIPIVWQLAKFGLTGVMNTAIDLGIYNILIFTTGYTKGTPLAIINAISFVFAVINSYWWNKQWVFDGVKTKNREELMQFIVVSIGVALTSSLVVKGVTDYISPLGGLSAIQWADAAKVLAIILSFLLNFFGYKFIVFKART